MQEQSTTERPPAVPCPPGWTVREAGLDGASYAHPGGLMVIWSIATERDEKPWLHLSLSRRNRMPDYADLRMVKECFIGDEYAVMVFPPRRSHVNLHPYCLHLYHCLAGHPLPEFSLNGLTI